MNPIIFDFGVQFLIESFYVRHERKALFSSVFGFIEESFNDGFVGAFEAEEERGVVVFVFVEEPFAASGFGLEGSSLTSLEVHLWDSFEDFVALF